MGYHNGMKFSTKDRDQDRDSKSCSNKYSDGGWWFNYCYKTHPNGLNSDKKLSGTAYITWRYGGDRPGGRESWNNWKGSEFTLVPDISKGIIMQRRIAGNTPDYFAKTFDEYKQGFSSNGEIWLGLEQIHSLTTSTSYGLVVRRTDWDNKEYIAVYDSFKVGPGNDYTLSISGFNSSSSTLGNSMGYHNGMKFSTKDRDQDRDSNSCSNKYSDGGWWFNYCYKTHPNGLNSDKKLSGTAYITWRYGGDRPGGRESWDNWKGSEFT